MVLMSGPLGQIITDVIYPLAIEKMAGWFERIRCPGVLPKVKQRWESKPHPAAFIGNRGSTLVTADLAGQNTLIYA